MEIQVQIRDFLKSRFGDALLGENDFADQQTYRIKPDMLFDICQAFMEETTLDIRYLADITSVDWLDHASEKDGRFEVIYNLYSLKHQHRFFLSVRIPGENPTLSSLTPLWQGANWMEREIYDLMGIQFSGHPNLIRILTPDDTEGYPLRRDYPLNYEVPQFSHNIELPPEVID